METYRYCDLVAEGLPEHEIKSLVSAGELIKVRHGGYARGQYAAGEQAHRALIATTVPTLAPDSVLSHQSAALLWGLPVPLRLLDKVHATRGGSSGGNVTATLHSHRRLLAAQQITSVDGYLVTTLARSAVDLATMTRRPESLAVLDAALRLGCPVDLLAEELDASGRRRGIGLVRWSLPHANGLSESPGESISRYWMIMGGVAEPELQFEVRDDRGHLLGRSDFAWPAHRVLGEFDGQIKYEEASGLSDRSVTEVVMAEKRRETSIFFDGWRMLRWGMADLRAGRAFASRLGSYLGRLTPNR